MNDLIKSILKSPIISGVIGFILFLLIPQIRIYIVVITVIIVIASIGKNGVYLYFSYSSFSALIASLLSLFNESSSVYQQLNISVNLLTFASIGNIIDLIFYVESSGWNGFQNLIAAIVFGILAYISYKLFE